MFFQKTKKWWSRRSLTSDGTPREEKKCPGGTPPMASKHKLQSAHTCNARWASSGSSCMQRRLAPEPKNAPPSHRNRRVTDIHFMCITTSWRYKHFCGDFTHVIHKKNFGDTQKIRNNFDVIQIFLQNQKNMLGLFISLPLSVNVGPGQRLFSAPGGEEVNNPKGGPTHPPRR